MSPKLLEILFKEFYFLNQSKFKKLIFWKNISVISKIIF